MTFYTPKPSLVEALRFEGGSNAMHIMSWLTRHNLITATYFAEQPEYTSEDGQEGCPFIPAQLDIGVVHVKIAEVGDYIVRRVVESTEGLRKHQIWQVLTEEQFKATYDAACDTCSGQIRETVGLVCRTCGHDYSKGT
jgi:hypothetical protein